MENYTIQMENIEYKWKIIKYKWKIYNRNGKPSTLRVFQTIPNPLPVVYSIKVVPA
jgi:hypothetical protein